MVVYVMTSFNSMCVCNDLEYFHGALCEDSVECGGQAQLQQTL